MIKDFVIENGELLKYHGSDKHVVIPEGVTEIGMRAFYRQPIKSIVIPKSVKKIGTAVFERCENLERIEIPGSVTEIGPTAFFGCISLKSIALPKGLKELGMYAFSKCESLENIDLTSDLLVIRERTFDGCTNLKSAVLPVDLTLIEQYAFKDCVHLSRVNLPESLKEIKYCAFYGCTKLKLTGAPDHSIKVGEKAFYGSDPSVEAALSGFAKNKLEQQGGIYSASIVTVTNLRRHKNADNLQCTEINGFNLIVDISCTIGQRMVFFPCGGQLDLEFARDNRLLNEAGGTLDSNKRFIRPITLRGEKSEGLLLPIEVLSKYTDIEQLRDGDRFTTLNGYELCRFYHSSAYKIDEETGTLVKCSRDVMFNSILRIPYGVRIIPRKLFRGNKTFKTVIIPYTVEEIEEDAFSGSAVESVSLSNGLQRIGDYAFAGCQNLKSIVIPGSVKRIERFAFYGCDGLGELTIEDGVEFIGENAFEKCSKLKKINIPDSVKKIGIAAFVDCTGADHIRIPENVKVLGNTHGATALESLTVDPLLLEFKFVDDVVFNWEMTELIRYPNWKTGAKYTIPSCVKKIRESAFFGNNYLTEVIIPNGVTHIGHRAFENCKNLQCVTIPPSVKYMGNFVFIGIHTSPNSKQFQLSRDIGKSTLGEIMAAANSYAVVEGVRIRGKRGSKAERYAKEVGCIFEVI